MYQIVKLAGATIRMLYAPNPFDMFELGILYNYIAEPIIHAITFRVVGVFYESGEGPILGSVLYTVLYFIHYGMLMVMSFFSWNAFVAVLITVLYIVGIGYIKSRVIV